MADAKGSFQFLERGSGLLFDVRVELGRVQFAPGTPTGFGAKVLVLTADR